MTREQMDRLLAHPPTLDEAVRIFLSWAAPSDSPTHQRIREIVPELIRRATKEERQRVVKIVKTWEDAGKRSGERIAAYTAKRIIDGIRKG